ncbi:hypothetical protein F5Y15DRAFT_428280 [Xylariaceae sp. FL0016]|nr:hypothetical protein F5Y15DRAFT_428280 [Xylariaceae sp. FL0016]
MTIRKLMIYFGAVNPTPRINKICEVSQSDQSYHDMITFMKACLSSTDSRTQSGQSYHDMITFMKEWQIIHNNSNSNLDTIDVRPTAKYKVIKYDEEKGSQVIHNNSNSNLDTIDVRPTKKYKTTKYG